jgi:chromosome segregation ATPase
LGDTAKTKLRTQVSELTQKVGFLEEQNKRQERITQTLETEIRSLKGDKVMLLSDIKNLEKDKESLSEKLKRSEEMLEEAERVRNLARYALVEKNIYMENGEKVFVLTFIAESDRARSSYRVSESVYNEHAEKKILTWATLKNWEYYN